METARAMDVEMGLFSILERRPVDPVIEQRMTENLENAILAILEGIKLAPDGLISGHLYARLMELGCTLNQFQAVERIIIGTGKVKREGFILKWVA